MNLRRSPKVSILLFLLVGLVAFKVYRIWEEGLPELPGPVLETSRVSIPKERRSSLRSLRRSTANIVKKNLFDPARGAGGEEVAEDQPQSKQAPEEYVLLGTLITSGGRKALIRVLPASRSASVRGRRTRNNGSTSQLGEVRRIAQGEPVGDFLLAEIQPHKVILTKGSEQVELVLDFIARPQKFEKPKIEAPRPKKTASPSKRTNSRARNRRDRDR